MYRPVNLSLVLSSPKRVRVEMPRVTYTLSVRVVDRSVGVLVGRFVLYANGTVVASRVGVNATVELPYGNYVLRLVPEEAWERAYSESRPVTLSLTNNTSITIPVERKLYRLRVVVLEGTNPVSNALVTVISEESYAIITQLLTDDRGAVETMVPYGPYRITVSHPSYAPVELYYVTVYDNRYVAVEARPTLVTLLWRFAPVAGVLIGVGIAIYVAMRIRAAMLKRLVAEEEMF